MISRLKGVVDVIFYASSTLILDVSGVGYEVYMDALSLQCLSVGQHVVLEIEMSVKEDQMRLYGFIDLNQKHWFALLQSIQGVGAKVALAILGKMSISKLQDAVLSSDHKAIQMVQGIGPKLALRIVNELNGMQSFKNLLTGINLENTTASHNDKIVSDACYALDSLGFSKSIYYKVISDIFSNNPDISLEELIRIAISKMNQ